MPARLLSSVVGIAGSAGWPGWLAGLVQEAVSVYIRARFFVRGRGGEETIVQVDGGLHAWGGGGQTMHVQGLPCYVNPRESVSVSQDSVLVTQETIVVIRSASCVKVIDSCSTSPFLTRTNLVS